MNLLTHKQLKTHQCVISTVATNALVLKHQAICIPQYWSSIGLIA